MFKEQAAGHGRRTGGLKCAPNRCIYMPLAGLRWTALPTPGPFSTLGLAPEVGGVARLGGKVYMLKTFLFESSSGPNGTFSPVAKNHDFFGPSRPSSLVLFLPDFQYLLEPFSGVWLLGCGVLTSREA